MVSGAAGAEPDEEERRRVGTGGRRARAGLLAAAAVALAVGGLGATLGGTDTSDVPVGPGAVASAGAERAPATVAPGPGRQGEASPATTATTTTTVAPVPASTPVEPPADPRAPEPAVVLGMIEIPRIDLVAPLNEGISLVTIDRGPSHWPGSALPGEVGNVVVAGHRVTKTRPFRHIDRLVPGDEVVLTAPGVRATYAVRGHEVVTPDAMRIVDPTPTATLTLFACHPPGSARYRYVVTADLVRTDALPR